ncbi:MAG: DUF364 domain-containing protein [Caldimicrobium sp.]|nr:DUF364 domain-containing protein [Caldimicrobium sp.]MCX7612817.1 DUF364 domain-containing protein [Caldimicrobium sp.]MDW8183311.1 DUF364 domain-containing protein [Caldimicrobium sp.]
MEPIYEGLTNLALSLARAKKVKRVLIGLTFTFAEVERTGCGIAYTPGDILKDCCELYEGSFWREPADLLVKKYLSFDTLESTVALAVINSLLNNRKDIVKDLTEEDPLKIVELSTDDEILMVGHFEPIFKKLERRVGRIWLLEKDDMEEGLKAIKDKGRISLAIVTSATLANKTFHRYIPILERIPEVILMGPSTPIAPEVFKFSPVTWLSGVIIKDGELVFKLICEGKGARALFKAGALQKVNLRIKK